MQAVLEDIWFALQLITSPQVNLPPEVRIPAPMVHVSPAQVHLPAPVVNYQPPDIHIPPSLVTVEQAPWPPDLLDAISAIRDGMARIPQGSGGGEPIAQPPVLEALGRIEKLLSQQRMSEGRTLGLVPPKPSQASDGSALVTLAGPAYDATDAIFSGATSLTPKFALISTSANGASQVVAAVASRHIRVLSGFLVASAATNVKFQSHVTPTDVTGLMNFALNGGAVLPYNPLGNFQTIAGEALDINLSAANAVGGAITYVEAP